MDKLRSILAIPAREWLGLLEAGVLLALARLLILSVPARYWRLSLSEEGGESREHARLAASERDTVVAVSRSIARAVRFAPVAFVCLPQALTARWMLRRRGIEARLYFGTRHAAEEVREFHAWVKVGRTWVTGHCNEEDYVIFHLEKNGM